MQTDLITQVKCESYNWALEY